MKKEKKKKVLFVCNRGGHLSEMMSLKPLFYTYNSLLLTEKTEIIVNNDIGIPIKYISSFRRKRKQPIISLIYFFINIFQCIHIYIAFRPQIIITTGANLSVIVCFLGKICFSKIIFIETGAKVFSKTKTGKILEPICDLIIVQWPEMLKVYKRAVYWGQTL